MIRFLRKISWRSRQQEPHPEKGLLQIPQTSLFHFYKFIAPILGAVHFVLVGKHRSLFPVMAGQSQHQSIKISHLGQQQNCGDRASTLNSKPQSNFARYDLYLVTFWVLRSSTNIAVIESPGKVT
jgi:hypothetical protein